MTLFKKLGNLFTIVVLLCFTTSFIIILLPVALVMGILHLFKKDVHDLKFHEFLVRHEGLQLFCYNNRRNSQSFIEENILPGLPAQVKIVLVRGKTPTSEFDPVVISKLLLAITDRKGFPYLITIRNSKLEYSSIHKELYDRMSQRGSLEPLIAKMQKFYSKEFI